MGTDRTGGVDAHVAHALLNAVAGLVVLAGGCCVAGAHRVARIGRHELPCLGLALVEHRPGLPTPGLPRPSSTLPL